MKRRSIIDNLEIILIPLITYLFIGLYIITSLGLEPDSFNFSLCAILAGATLGVQVWFNNRMITLGIIVYGIVVVLWLFVFLKDIGTVLATMLAAGFLGIYLCRVLMRLCFVKIAIGYAALIGLIVGTFLDVPYGKVPIVLAIVLLLYSVSETIALYYPGNTKSLLMIYILVAVLTAVVPVSDKPYDWAFVFHIVDIMENVTDKVKAEIQYQFGDNAIFRFHNTGYSDTGAAFSGDIMEWEVSQLSLYGTKTLRNLYLKGNVSNEYDGSTWKRKAGEAQDYRIDTLMTLYAIVDVVDDYSELRKFMDVKEQTIYFENIQTYSLFYPLKLLSITEDGMEAEADNLRLKQIGKRGYNYSYKFVDIDYANPIVIDILKKSKDMVYEETTYDRVYNLLKEYYDVNLEKIPYETFVEQAEKAQKVSVEQYLSLNEYISENVKKLAFELTEDSINAYDTCKKLESFLYQYHYNKAISVPQDVNMLDWFLFEQKEGYCVHYATALAVMLRCQEIPSRFLEGFLVDYKEYVDVGTYSISSNRAHAWVEAYIDGFGWIRLEPTVTYAGNANKIWFKTSNAEDDIGYEEFVTSVEETKTEEVIDNGEAVTWNIMIKIFAGMVIFIAFVFVAAVLYRKIQIQKSKNPDIVFAHMLAVLDKKYLAKEEAETIGEYFERLESSEELSEDIRGKMPAIRALAEAYWYGGKMPSLEELEFIKTLRK